MFKPAALVAGMMVLWVAVESKAPAIAGSAELMVQAGQEQFRQKAPKLTRIVPIRVPCDRKTAPTLIFFETNLTSGEADVAIWYSRDDDRIQCWDQNGIHPQTGEKLLPMTKKIVEQIKRQSAEGETETAETDAASRAPTGKDPVHRRGRIQRFDRLP
jgi:hypothetical protein